MITISLVLVLEGELFFWRWRVSKGSNQNKYKMVSKYVEGNHFILWSTLS